jgi:hypothetical protein
MSTEGSITVVLAGFAVLFLVGLVVLDVTAHVCKKVRVIRNTPVTWSGREYRNVTSRVSAPRTSAPRNSDATLVGRLLLDPNALVSFPEHQRMLALGFVRDNGQWRKQ